VSLAGQPRSTSPSLHVLCPHLKRDPSMPRTTLAATVALFLPTILASPLAAQASQISFTTTEGTWVSLDVAPDGRSLVFELLGDVYVLPVDGGRARPVLTGSAFQSQPRFSPDGRLLAYVSDESGTDNVWIARGRRFPASSGNRQGSLDDALPCMVRGRLGDLRDGHHDRRLQLLRGDLALRRRVGRRGAPGRKRERTVSAPSVRPGARFPTVLPHIPTGRICTTRRSRRAPMEAGTGRRVGFHAVDAGVRADRGGASGESDRHEAGRDTGWATARGTTSSRIAAS
jgi:hypothetical protein